MAKPKIRITIAIPAYNAEKTLAESILSAKAQEYPNKEILVYDDGSTDRTSEIAKAHGCRLIKNKFNHGIGKALEILMRNTNSEYIVYLCSDDVFTNSMVVSDIVNIFNKEPKVGIVGRYYYQYMNGHKGAIMECRDPNILTGSCNPSGMAFRVDKEIVGSNRIFIEMPLIVKQYLEKGWHWALMTYDTIAARIHPKGNTGTKEEYYTDESPLENWVSLVGPKFRFHEGFVQLKNRCPRMLWKEIKTAIRVDRTVLLEPSFWFYASVALIVPRVILQQLSNFYRHRITRYFCAIIERQEPKK